jgi:hypothetical protein
MELIHNRRAILPATTVLALARAIRGIKEGLKIKPWAKVEKRRSALVARVKGKRTEARAKARARTKAKAKVGVKEVGAKTREEERVKERARTKLVSLGPAVGRPGKTRGDRIKNPVPSESF